MSEIKYIPLTDEEMGEILKKWAASFVKATEKALARINAAMAEEAIQRRVGLAIEEDRKQRGDDDWGGNLGFGQASPAQQAQTRLAELSLESQRIGIQKRNNLAFQGFIERLLGSKAAV